MKKEIKVISIKDSEKEDFEYWLNKSPEEKLDTLQYLREMVYELKNENRKGFQRFLKITKRKKR